MNRTAFLYGGALGVLATVAIPAIAQTAPHVGSPSGKSDGPQQSDASGTGAPVGQSPDQTSTAPTANSVATTSDNTSTDIIVTAAPTAGGVRRMEASFSAVALNQEQLKAAGLTASADVLKASPGVFIESSGSSGAGANVEVVGFPSNSLSPFATFELQGSSLFPMAGQVFLDGPNFLRPDDTVQRVELVQGGPAVLYGDGQPGLTANYVLKQGSDKATGTIAGQYGFEGYERVDAFLAGPLSKDDGLYGSIGGYWNRNDGIRNPQYTADKGGQITATLTKKWDPGSLMVYGRYLKFNDEFVTDTPIILSSDGSFSSYPGFSPLTGTVSSRTNQFLDLPIGPCTGPGCNPATIRLNGADGRGSETGVVGGEFHWDFGNNIEILDNFSVSRGTSYMTALYSSPINPESLQAFVTARETATKLTGITGVNAYYTNDGSAVPLTQSVLEAEVRYLKMKFHAESNEIHLSIGLFPGNTLTIGNKTTLYGINQLYYTGADILLQAQNNPTPIGVNLTNGVTNYQLTSSEGFVNGSSAIQANVGHGINTALFLSDSWAWHGFLLDVGARGENQSFNEYNQNTASTNLTGNATNLWGTGRYITGTGTTRYHYNRNALSWTVGLNYEFSPHFSAYVRANKGVHFLAFSDVTGLPIGNDGPLETAHNYQGGIKFSTSFIYADVSGFYRTFRNVPVSITGIPIPGTTTTGTGTIVYGSNTPGLEYSIVLTPFAGNGWLGGFSLGASGDYAVAKYTQSNGCIYYTGGTTPLNFCVAADNFTGKRLARQPDFQTRISPAYKTSLPWGTVRLFSNFEYIGHRYSDMLQAQALPHYYDLSAGMQATYGNHWELLVTGTNLTNQIGVTEENPRVAFGSGVPAPGPQLARSIDGREVLVQVRFKF